MYIYISKELNNKTKDTEKKVIKRQVKVMGKKGSNGMFFFFFSYIANAK